MRSAVPQYGQDTLAWEGAQTGKLPEWAGRPSAALYQLPQHGIADRRGAVAPAEFTGPYARGEHAIDCGLDRTGGLTGAVMAVPVGEPVEHHGGGEDHGGGIGQPLAHDIGGGAVAGLEHRVG